MTARVLPTGGVRTPAAAALLAAAVLCAAGASGCAGERLYRANDLPAELQAAPVVNVRTLDLTHLAGPPVDRGVIETGDVIEVAICAGLSTDDVIRIPVRVTEEGMALLPEIGPVPVAGLSLAAAEQAVGATCTQRGFYRQPQVTVTMREQRLNRITVVGAVKSPGVIELPRGSSYLLAAIVAAGGLAADAGPRVEIRVPTGNTGLAAQPPQGVQLAAGYEPTASGVAYVCLNLAESVGKGDGGRYLPDGSVITIEARDLQPYQVIGLVKNPGQYNFPMNYELRLLGAIAQAGGVSQSLADKVHIIRSKPDGSEDVTIEVSLKEAKRDRGQNLRLQPGDVVSVEHTPATIIAETIQNIPFHIGASVPIF